MTLASQPPPPSPSGGGGNSLGLLHPDIIRTNILSRLDGRALAAAACASFELCSLISDDDIWQDAATAMWPSTTDPKLRRVISTFESGFRSFYADAYRSPLRFPTTKFKNLLTMLISEIPFLHSPTKKPTTKLISAIDVFYGGDLVFSKVQETETCSPQFMSSPLRIKAKDRAGAPIPIPNPRPSNRTALINKLEENLRLSWILIDPTRKRAMRLLSHGPVRVRACSRRRVILARFASVLGRDELDMVEFSAAVKVEWERNGAAGIRKISMRMDDVDGEGISGEESLVILAPAIEGGRRRTKPAAAEKKRFEEFERMKTVQLRRREIVGRILHVACSFITFLAFFHKSFLYRIIAIGFVARHYGPGLCSAVKRALENHNR